MVCLFAPNAIASASICFPQITALGSRDFFLNRPESIERNALGGELLLNGIRPSKVDRIVNTWSAVSESRRIPDTSKGQDVHLPRVFTEYRPFSRQCR